MATAIQEREAEVVRRLTESSTGQALLDEAAAELVEKRKGQVAELAELRAGEESAAPARETAGAKAKAKVEKAWGAWEAAVAAYRAVQVANSGLETSTLIGRLEAELHETADPAIQAFIHELSLESERTRKKFGFHTFTDRHPVTLEPEAVTVSNTEAVKAAQSAINSARLEAEAMKLQALTGDEVQARIATLNSGISALTSGLSEMV